MMSKFIVCMFLLVNGVADLLSVSGAAYTFKSVCPGSTVQAFQNIKLNRCNAVVSLDVNGERNARIATWSFFNCTLNATLLPEYKERVFLDQTGTISIRDIHHFDQGKYLVISQMDSFPMIYEVEISVMVLPTKGCKPKIRRLGNILLASLNANDCGIPAATPYWKDNDDVSSTNKAKLTLTQGNEAGTYYACIEGPALDCVRNLTPQDYCTSITIEGSKSSPMASETLSTTVVIVLGVLFAVLIIVSITVIAILVRKRRRNNPENRNKETSEDKTGKKSESIIELEGLLHRDHNMTVMPYSHEATCASCSSTLNPPIYSA